MVLATSQITVMLVIYAISAAFILFALLPRSKTWAGFATMIFGLTLTGLERISPEMSQYIFGSVFIVIVIGLFLLFTGATGRR